MAQEFCKIFTGTPEAVEELINNYFIEFNLSEEIIEMRQSYDAKNNRLVITFIFDTNVSG